MLKSVILAGVFAAAFAPAAATAQPICEQTSSDGQSTTGRIIGAISDAITGTRDQPTVNCVPYGT